MSNNARQDILKAIRDSKKIERRKNTMVLININMPSCCEICELYDDRDGYPSCFATGVIKGYDFDPQKERMFTCPLREIEKEKK